MATQGFSAQVHHLPIRSGNAILHVVWSWLALMVQVRRTRHLLGEMDDRMLSDIGVDQAQAQTEAARPAWDLAER